MPIFLSVGYSSCHWCHVMAHESFEDPATGALMNQLFVNVKVDREERPDVDAIYMQAVQALTGRGGWPMSVWCAPDGRPFYAGTYFPNDERHGMTDVRARVRGGRRGVARSPRRGHRAEHAADRRDRRRPRRDRQLGAGRRRRDAGDRLRQRARAVRAAVRRLRTGAEVPAGDDARLLVPRPGPRAERRDADDDHDHARRDGRRRHPRPSRRRIRALLHRRLLAGPPLREDALRQRVARPARTCTATS